LPVPLLPATNARPTVLLADDHAPTAEQLRALLQAHFDVVGVVADVRALATAAEQLAPDAIVADIAMPYLDGIDAVELIRQRNSATGWWRTRHARDDPRTGPG
jgi:CheY-like chemotaxis protein